MKKRIFCLFTAFLLCASLALPAFAAKYPAGIDKTLPRMDDGAGLLLSVPVEALNARARELSEQYRMDLVILTRRGLGGKTPMDYADDYFDYGGYGWRDEETDDIKTGSGMILLLDMQERDIWISTKGEGMNVFPDSRVTRIREAITPELGSGQYRAAFSRFLDEAEKRLEDYRNRDNSTAERTTIAGKYPAGIDDSLPRIVDEALLLSGEEAAALDGRLRAIVEQHEMDVVIVTREGLDGLTPMEYADDFFDYEGYGWREESSDDITTGSGILLLVEMEQGEIWISTKGRGMSVFGDGEIQALTDLITPDLGNGMYFDAFDYFLTDTEWYLSNYAGSYDGNSDYDNDHDYTYEYSYSGRPYFNGGIFFVVALIGLIIALSVVNSMKKKHNTIRTAVAAQTYQQRFDLTERQDIFLYSNTTRVKLPDDPPPVSHSSGGHSSSSGSSHGGGGGSFGGGHSSSSGSSHGGGGGKF